MQIGLYSISEVLNPRKWFLMRFGFRSLHHWRAREQWRSQNWVVTRAQVAIGQGSFAHRISSEALNFVACKARLCKGGGSRDMLSQENFRSHLLAFQAHFSSLWWYYSLPLWCILFWYKPQDLPCIFDCTYVPTLIFEIRPLSDFSNPNFFTLFPLLPLLVILVHCQEKIAEDKTSIPPISFILKYL